MLNPTASLFARTSLAVLIVALRVSAASGQDLPDIVTLPNDARAMGMGYAATGAARGVSALGWNPAGLMAADGRDVQLALRSHLAMSGARETSLSGSSRFDGWWGFGNLVPTVEFAGFAQPFTVGSRRFVAAAAWRSFVTGDYSQGVIADTPTGPGVSYTETVVSSGGVRALTFGLATRPASRLAVGLSANILHGSQQSTRTVETNHETFVNRTVRKTTFDGTSGVALDVGAQYAVGDGRIGARVTLPHSRRSTMSRTGSADTDVEWSVPMLLAVGIETPIAGGWTASADVRLEPLANAEMRDVDADTTVEGYGGLDDVHSLHLGFERRSVHQGRDRIWRLGVYTRPSSHRDTAQTQIGGFGFSAGHTWVTARRRFSLNGVFHHSGAWHRRTNNTRHMSSSGDLRLVFAIEQ